MNQPDPSAELLRRYLAGQCTPAECRHVDNWYRHVNKTGQADKPLALNEKALFDRIRADITDDESFGEAPVRPLWRQPVWHYAAASVAAVVLVVMGLWSISRPPTPPVVTTLPGRQATLVVYQNQTRRVQRQTLPDGSVVWLNPGAKLQLAGTFSKAVRAVQFEGEAFFEVAKDPARPFVIQSGRMTTQVLGTSFNVKAPANGANYKVSVVTGRVSVSGTLANGQRRTLLLKPSQQAVYKLTTNDLARQEVVDRPGDKETWQPISLTFDDATLSQTARQLERTFNIQIRLDNPALANCRLTVDFNQQRLPEILDIIDKLLGTQYTLVDDQVVLTGRGCAL